MKIGIDARFWNESGVGRYIRNLIFNLLTIDQTNQYILFAKTNDVENLKSQISNLKNKNWKIIPVDIPWHSIQEQIKFPKILNQQNLDLMHFPYFSMPIFYQKPFIITIHDLILHHFSTGQATTKSPIIYKSKLVAYKTIMKISAQKAQKIITVSHATKDEIVDHLKIPPEKITVTYEGIDKKLISSLLDIGHWTLEVKSYFLHVGNLYPHKNIQLLLKAWKKLKQQEINFPKLIIVGKNDYFSQRVQKTIKQENLEKEIICLGEVSDSQLGYLYHHALGLISPSLMEGFDLPTVEAMSANCLVLASDIPVHKEICQTAAVYFQSDNLEDLMIKLIQIAKAPSKEYKQKKETGQQLANQYSWKKMAEQTKEIYENCTRLR